MKNQKLSPINAFDGGGGGKTNPMEFKINSYLKSRFRLRANSQLFPTLFSPRLDTFFPVLNDL